MNIVINNTVQSNELFADSRKLESMFSHEAIKHVRQFLERQIDYLIIRGMPVSSSLPPTPQVIRSDTYPKAEADILTAVAQKIGKISPKGIENTIRFVQEGQKTNIETWHSHFQYSASVFYCLRGDPAARTYFLTANEIMANAGDIRGALVTPFSFIEGTDPFALIELDGNTHKFSKCIFDRSELEKHIRDLDLPDAIKALKRIRSANLPSDARDAVEYLIGQLERPKESISYVPGDLVLVNEQRVIRYSPSFETTAVPTQARWLLAVSILQ